MLATFKENYELRNEAIHIIQNKVDRLVQIRDTISAII